MREKKTLYCSPKTIKPPSVQQEFKYITFLLFWPLLPPNNFLSVPKVECEVFDLWKLMCACWNSHVSGIFKSVCVSGGLWLVRLALFTLSPPSPDSSLGMTAIMHMPQQLQVRPTHFPILQPTNPHSAAKALTMISGWTRGWSGESKWANGPYEQRGGVNKASLSPEGGGDAFSRGAQEAETNHGLNFLTRQQDLRRNWFNTPPQWWQAVSLFAVAIETGTGSLSLYTVIPLQWLGILGS